MRYQIVGPDVRELDSVVWLSATLQLVVIGSDESGGFWYSSLTAERCEDGRGRPGMLSRAGQF